MGDSSRIDRSEKFLKEFREDAKKLYAPGPEGQKMFPSWDIDAEEDTYLVKLYWGSTVDGKPMAFVPDNAPVFYDPSESERDVISRVMDVFDLDRETALKRLKKAELIRENMK